jgi:hypothetical protein
MKKNFLSKSHFTVLVFQAAKRRVTDEALNSRIEDMILCCLVRAIGPFAAAIAESGAMVE